MKVDSVAVVDENIFSVQWRNGIDHEESGRRIS